MADAVAVPTRWERFFDHVSLASLVFVGLHIGAFVGPFWLGVRWSDPLLAFGVYFVQAFGLAAGYHRYFAHRAFKTSRPFQFVLALLGTISGQRGVIWWAQYHRHHHRHSDTPLDIHSPALQGFFYAHACWGFDRRVAQARPELVPDIAAFPELIWLERWSGLIFIAFGAGLGLAFGTRGLIYGFCWGTLLSWHAVSCIVSLSHSRLGSQRYPTAENSRNIWWLAPWTLGEAWHNNHHYYPISARQGFYWWEFDPTYDLLRVLRLLGLVWDLRTPPTEVRDRHEAVRP